MTSHKAATEPNKVEQCAVGQLKPYPNNARTRSLQQIKQIARSIERFGFVNPVLADASGQIIAGHGRVEAAKQLAMPKTAGASSLHSAISVVLQNIGWIA